MCGRYQINVTLEDLQELLPGFELRVTPEPRYNVAPTQVVPVAFNDERVVRPAKWGLVPRWAKDPSIGSRMINARAESVHEKPSYREPLARRRCLVPVTGFYEWSTLEGAPKKTPHLIRVAGGRPFALAGLWDEWSSAEGPVRTFTIVTTAANPAIAPLHDRMPVILPREAWDAWMDAGPKPAQELLPLLVPFAGDLEIRQVSTVVNSVKNDGAECEAVPDPVSQLNGNGTR